MMRPILALAVGYLVIGLVTRLMEVAGTRTCGCDPDCWCKMPGLSLLRWVLPRGHKNRAIAEWKAAQGSD